MNSANEERLRNWKERFWSRVQKTDGCWIWMARKNIGGYGDMRVNHKKWLVHRVSYLIHFGPIPPKMKVCHHCDNCACVRPDHLFLGTQKDNMHDAIKKGRFVTASHRKLTWGQVGWIRNLYGSMTQVQLAELFDVKQATISCITRNATWKDESSAAERLLRAAPWTAFLSIQRRHTQ